MKKVLLMISLVCVFCLSACGAKNTSSVKENAGALKKITIAATPSPHAEILEYAKTKLTEMGYDLIIKEFNDYVQPNLVTDSGEVDANYFQHFPYLDDFNKERGTKVVSVGSIHYEPFAIYAGKSKELKVPDGAKIAVPNDVTNEARALNLLESAGLIKLKEGSGLNATKLDIVENPQNLEIVELESAQIPRSIDSVDLACMNGNYALEAGYNVSDALYVEKADSEAAKTYANIICVAEKNKDAQFAKDLVYVLKSDEIINFINDKYKGAVLPAE